jgi:hypothetical protein
MQKLFVVGCPRSGTTWLQIVLGSHPEIATTRETHLFDRYLAGLYGQFGTEEHELAKDGLRVFMSAEAMDVACRAFADEVFARIAATKPGAKVLLEKTASHVWHTRLIRRLYPDAIFLNVVRDPRAVVASMRAFGQESWARAGQIDVLSAAKTWRQAATIGHVELRRDPEHLIEIRYEDMSADPDGVLARIYERLGVTQVPYDRARFSIDEVKKHRQEGDPSDPAWENRENFFRRGTTDGWRDDLAPDQIAVIEAICGDLMAEFGYPA